MNPDPFQREHEIADALTRLLIAHSRYGADSDPERLPLIERITILLAQAIGERVESIRGKQAGREFREMLARKQEE
jgi:hypothetical protein